MGAVGEKAFESFLCLGNGIGPCHAESVEAERAGTLGKRRLDGGRIAQKSRSA
jgi:hypothetical protein